MKSGEQDGGPVIFLRDLDKGAQEVVSRRLMTAGDTVTQGLMNWGFEVIKHLAVFNGAGLAGAAAFAQAYGSDPIVHKLALSGAHLFVVGLAIALITMVVCLVTGFVHNLSFAKRVMFVLLNSRPLTDMKLTLGFWVGCSLTWGLTLTSIVLFFMGALRIVAIV